MSLLILNERVFSRGLERTFSLGLDRAFLLGQDRLELARFEIQFVDVGLALAAPNDAQEAVGL